MATILSVIDASPHSSSDSSFSYNSCKMSDAVVKIAIHSTDFPSTR